jgi:hypothetical protein
VEDDLVAPADGDDLPVASPHGTLGPPAVLHQPLLAHGVDLAPVDEEGATGVIGAYGDAARDG